MRGVEAIRTVQLGRFAVHLDHTFIPRILAAFANLLIQHCLVPPQTERRDVRARHLPILLHHFRESGTLLAVHAVPSIDTHDVDALAVAKSVRFQCLLEVFGNSHVHVIAIPVRHHAPALPAKGCTTLPCLTHGLHQSIDPGILLHSITPIGKSSDEHQCRTHLRSPHLPVRQLVARFLVRHTGEHLQRFHATVARSFHLHRTLPAVMLHRTQHDAPATLSCVKRGNLVRGHIARQTVLMVTYETVIVERHFQHAVRLRRSVQVVGRSHRYGCKVVGTKGSIPLQYDIRQHVIPSLIYVKLLRKGHVVATGRR